MTLKDELNQRLREMTLDLPAQAVDQLIRYIELLEKWNRTYNLTAVREPEKMLYQHVLDSLAVLPELSGPRLLDVGSGGGLPGIPLAIARPDWQVVLLDSNSKKTTFLRQAAVELGLKNVEVVCDRVENYQPGAPLNTVISRAFADLAEYAELTRHLLSPDSTLVAMKGLYPHEELEQLPDGFAVDRVDPVDVPGLSAQRHLVIMKMVTDHVS